MWWEWTMFKLKRCVDSVGLFYKNIAIGWIDCENNETYLLLNISPYDGREKSIVIGVDDI